MQDVTDAAFGPDAGVTESQGRSIRALIRARTGSTLPPNRVPASDPDCAARGGQEQPTPPGGHLPGSDQAGPGVSSM
jgi:hypothetical protein